MPTSGDVRIRSLNETVRDYIAQAIQETQLGPQYIAENAGDNPTDIPLELVQGLRDGTISQIAPEMEQAFERLLQYLTIKAEVHAMA